MQEKIDTCIFVQKWVWNFLTSSQAMDSRGIMVVIGRGAPEVSISPAEIIRKELDIRGVFRYANW